MHGPLGGGPHEKKPSRKPLEIYWPHRFDRLGTSLLDHCRCLRGAEAGRTLSHGTVISCRRHFRRVGRRDRQRGFHDPTVDEKALIWIPALSTSLVSHSSAVRRVFR